MVRRVHQSSSAGSITAWKRRESDCDPHEAEIKVEIGTLVHMVTIETTNTSEYTPKNIIHETHSGKAT